VSDVIVSEWLGETGGAEQVLLRIAAALPSARIHALAVTDSWREQFPPGRLTTTPVGRLTSPAARRLMAPLMPAIWRVPPLSADRAVVLHHAFASSAVNSRVDLAVAYVHSPARYVWDPQLDPRGAGRAARIVARPLMRIDRAAAGRLDDIVCNSEATRQRIEKHWGVPARVLYPPVRTGLFRDVAVAESDPAMPAPGTYLIAYGRWISYKAFDTAIRVAAAADLPLVLCGGGPEEENLRSLSGELGRSSRVTFVRMPPTDVLVRLVQGARALLFPGVEDFGIIPLEAQSAGVPVLALGAGGALETVVDGVTGFLLPDLEPAEWARAVGRLDQIGSDACRTNADRFSERAFDEAARSWLHRWGFDPAPLADGARPGGVLE
jgi:glycosyltransferase involved in cell wall biosynthesis